MSRTYHFPRLWSTFCNAFGLQLDKKRILIVIMSAMTGIYTMKQGKRAKGRSPMKLYKYFKHQKGIFEVYLTHEPLLTSH